MPNGPKVRQGVMPATAEPPVLFPGGVTGMDRIEAERVGAPASAVRTRQELAELAADAQLTEAELQQETIARSEAQLLGLDYETEYKVLSPRVRAVLAYAAAPQEMINPWDNPQIDHEFGFSGRPQGTMSRAEFMKQYQAEPDFDQRTHVMLLRKPQLRVGPDGTERLYHIGGWQAISRRELPRKIREGWSTVPVAPLLPDPQHPCEVRFMGVACSVRSMTPQDVDTHMRHYHPEEFKTLEARRARAALESSQGTQSLTNEALVTLLRKLTGTVPPEPAV